jgi:hypothetical protein
MATEPARTYPSERPVLALRRNVVFPLTLQPLAINRPLSIEAVNRALTGDRLIVLALQNNEKDEPDATDIRAREPLRHEGRREAENSRRAAAVLPPAAAQGDSGRARV